MDARDDPDDTLKRRLVNLLGQLGSEFENVRAMAGLKAHEHLKRLGLTWADVISLPIADQHGGQERGRNNDSEYGCFGWRAQREFCLRHRARLNAKELGFLLNIGSWRGPLTEKQQAWLDSIHQRLGEAA
jgi:hypothetical protein